MFSMGDGNCCVVDFLAALAGKTADSAGSVR
jgi:hypothetical protein